MNLKLAAIATVITMIAGIFTVDDRYYKTAAADQDRLMLAEYRTQSDIARELGDVLTQIKVCELELKLADDPKRANILNKQLEALLERQNRLIEMQRRR